MLSIDGHITPFLRHFHVLVELNFDDKRDNYSNCYIEPFTNQFGVIFYGLFRPNLLRLLSLINGISFLPKGKLENYYT